MRILANRETRNLMVSLAFVLVAYVVALEAGLFLDSGKIISIS